MTEAVDSPYMLLVTPVARQHRTTLTDDDRGATGIAKLQRRPLGHPGRDARRLLGARADRRRRTAWTSTEPDRGLLRKTGCPVVVNTSFNLGWDPIVCTPEEAYSTFMACDLDVLCMGTVRLAQASSSAPGCRRQGGAPDFLDELLVCPCGSAAVVAPRGRRARERLRPSLSVRRRHPAAVLAARHHRRADRRHRARQGVLRRDAVPELRRPRLGALADREVAPRRLRPRSSTTRSPTTRGARSRLRHRSAERTSWASRAAA